MPGTTGRVTSGMPSRASSISLKQDTPLSPGSACADSDQDGMPDAFETRYGLDPNSAADAGIDSAHALAAADPAGVAAAAGVSEERAAAWIDAAPR